MVYIDFCLYPQYNFYKRISQYFNYFANTSFIVNLSDWAIGQTFFFIICITVYVVYCRYKLNHTVDEMKTAKTANYDGKRNIYVND